MSEIRTFVGEAVVGHAAVDVEESGAFLAVPAEVSAAGGDVDFLDVVLPDVADVKVAGLAIEGEAVGIAEAIRPDFWNGARLTDERVIRGNAVLLARREGRIDIDSQDLAEWRVELLAVAVNLVAEDRFLAAHRLVGRSGDEGLTVGVIGAAAVAHRDVEHPVRAEGQIAAVMVELWPVHAHELAPDQVRSGLGMIRI